MTKIKDIPKVDRPREKFLKKGPEVLSKSDLLAIVLGSGIKGKNVQKLAQQIIKKFSKTFLDVTVKDLQTVDGIGPAKALQIAAAISLVKRFYADSQTSEIIIKKSKDVLSLTYDLRDKKKEYLVCLYLDARNVLIKKEIISMGLVDKTLFHPREIFEPAFRLNASYIILVHNHPTGNPNPSKQDKIIVDRISYAGKINGIEIIDFIIVAGNEHYSFFQELGDKKKNLDYVAEGVQGTLFDLLEIEKPAYEISVQKIDKHYFQPRGSKNGYFQLQNRRYLGNKYKLLGFIEDIISEKCGSIDSLCDIFAGTGVVGERFNNPEIKIISNDFYFCKLCLLASIFGS